MRENDRTTHNEDLELVALCLGGEVDAFEGLVERYQKKMFNVAYRMIGNYEEACDAVQDAFVAAFRGLKGFQRRSSFSTWLFTIVINQSRNRLKKLRSQAFREDHSLNNPVTTEEGTVTIEHPSDDPSALELLEKKTVQEKVQGCIEALESQFREIIVLRDIQEFAYDEISEMLKIPQGTVKSRLFRARDAVRDCLKKQKGNL